LLKAAVFLLALYVFFVSIDLMSTAFKLAGEGFANQLLSTAENPVAGMLIGFLATALVQSSSSTTSIIVGLVAAGSLDLQMAVPMVMGANIGTTVTNTIVSIGHVTRRKEFQQAFAAAIVHDFFNVLAVMVLLPVEVFLHPIEKIARALSALFQGMGGLQLASPLKAIVQPATHLASDLVPHFVPLLVIALLALFLALAWMVKIMRSVVLRRVETLFNRVLFRNDVASFSFGAAITATVQSSSATTSLMVPLAGAGVLSIRRIFPYMLGANIGTTVTAILASLSTGSGAAVTVALSHLAFNVMGIVIFYPAKAIPINLAIKIGEVASRSRRSTIRVLAVYAAVIVVPLLYVILRQYLRG
jgi:sodium-dependent phosphate cotransporter